MRDFSVHERHEHTVFHTHVVFTHSSQSQVPISYTKYYRAKDGHIVEAKVTGHIVPAQGAV